MKIVIFEYITGGVYKSESLYTDLIKEADLMVNALGQGMAEVGCEIVLFRNPSLPPPRFEAEIITLTEKDDWHAILENELHHADAYIPLAPESNALLESLCLKAERTDCTLLNTSAETVRRTADKRYTLKQLESHHIPCVRYEDISRCTFPMSEDMVIKPYDGIACENTFLIRGGTVPTEEQRRYARICQPYLEGTDASLSVIYTSDSEPCILGVNRQEIEIDEYGCFRLKACHVNALAHLELDFDAMAVAVQNCFPDLMGYVGIDFVINDDVPYILEINPRVTTSFVGLARTSGVNPCAMLLAAIRGEVLQCPCRTEFTSYTIANFSL